MSRFHRLPELDHPNMIQRKAISGGGLGRDWDIHMPKAPGARKGPRVKAGKEAAHKPFPSGAQLPRGWACLLAHSLLAPTCVCPMREERLWTGFLDTPGNRWVAETWGGTLTSSCPRLCWLRPSVCLGHGDELP